jgi:hypothetical protein
MWVEVGGVELHQAHSQGEEGGAVSLRLPAVVQRLQQEHTHLHQSRLQQPASSGTEPGFRIQIRIRTVLASVADPDQDPDLIRI